MKYDLTQPCGNCPFRNDVAPYLTPGRVDEIYGHPFACHKTTESDDDGDSHITEKSQHCAGALIILEKNEQSHQMMRIMERIGGYDRHKLKMDSPVYDDLDEMLIAHEEAES